MQSQIKKIQTLIKAQIDFLARARRALKNKSASSARYWLQQWRQARALWSALTGVPVMIWALSFTAAACCSALVLSVAALLCGY